MLLELILAAKILSINDSMSIAVIVHQHLAHSDDLNTDAFWEGNYAVAWWRAESGHTGGSALVRKTKGDWVLVKMIDGSFDAAGLQALGVPAKDANNLILDLKKAH